jgi:hypothetical protein
MSSTLPAGGQPDICAGLELDNDHDLVLVYRLAVGGQGLLVDESELGRSSGDGPQYVGYRLRPAQVVALRPVHVQLLERG